jgi:hypothetical protein
MVAVLDADAHLLKHHDRAAAEVVRDAVRRVVVVSARVDGDRGRADLRALPEQEELDLRVRVEGEAHLAGLAQVALEHPAGVGVARRPVGQQDVAEHAGHAGILAAPGQQLERRRVGPRDHVRLVHAGEALDRRAVEADAVRKRALEFGGGDSDGLE